MNHARNNNFFKSFYESYIPNSRDNFKQISIKVLFLVSLVTLVVSATYIGNYFLTAQKESDTVQQSRDIWYEKPAAKNEQEVDEGPSPEEILKSQNSDFKGWISLLGANVDNPVYQTTDNSYYLDHNQEKKKSVYGALFFDCQNVITQEETDKNLIIYGHEMKNGTMFGSLKKLRNLSFYKENSTVELSLFGEKSVYRIYSVFVLNASREDDEGYIYNISRQNFVDDDDFNKWVDEALDRSIIDTNVKVEPDDDILTLVTCVSDFDNARLVVMAKKLDSNEDTSPINNAAHTNPDPRYPAKWYEARGIKR